ncbi:hypothetical protein WOLCODRAFT_23024 [Wolfiporia cocos MD-104 SS10]|uniref:Uncharacterized protein n=1 Tax=Wolfiporia cocos (strain MD-104) TaxID=742152 RepID=A0A2H3JMZ2_WOLCO|nr:hypothetical protein WOLCODRAFT_23024 [Wolfiporia cocos MD-104 SS10]
MPLWLSQRPFLLPARHEIPANVARRSNASISGAHIAALDQWIQSDKRLTLPDTVRPEHLSSLYVTLPTRDGSASDSPPEIPKEGARLGYGHHLVFFHPRNPERVLRADGTDVDFCPPEPWTRRMWAGGRFWWNEDRPLLIGDKAVATATISSVEKKGFEKGSPMVFVKQKIEYRREGASEVSIEEERSHVYLAAPGNRREARQVHDLPTPEFSMEYLPSPTTLFRLSALTFNGHYIHLDKDYAQKSEGYPERLVHGPLTALMLLEAFTTQNPSAVLKSFEYRAINPVLVNRSVSIRGAKIEGGKAARVWVEDTETKIVGMVGTILV